MTRRQHDLLHDIAHRMIIERIKLDILRQELTHAHEPHPEIQAATTKLLDACELLLDALEPRYTHNTQLSTTATNKLQRSKTR